MRQAGSSPRDDSGTVSAVTLPGGKGGGELGSVHLQGCRLPASLQPAARGGLRRTVMGLCLAFRLAHWAQFVPRECLGGALRYFGGRNKPNLLPSICRFT